MNDRDTLSKEHGIFLADDLAIICAASVLWQALKANSYVDVKVLHHAFDNADLEQIEGAGDAITNFLKALSEMPTPPRGQKNEGVSNE